LENNVTVKAPLEFFKAQDLMEIENLPKAMTKIRAQVVGKTTQESKAAFQKNKDKTPVRSSKF
jgi:hypothetical protein